MSCTVERTITNPVYGVNTSTTHSHNDYVSNELTYEAVTNNNQTYSTLNNQPNNNKNNTAHLPTVEEYNYHVLESNDYEGVECEYSVIREGGGCEGVYSVAGSEGVGNECVECEGVYSVASEGAGCEGVCSDYEVPRSSKIW